MHRMGLGQDLWAWSVIFLPQAHQYQETLPGRLLFLIWRSFADCKSFEILQELWKKCLTYREGYSIFSFVGNMQHARVAQRWSTSLPRRGSRVRSPSRALEYKNRYPFGYLFFCIRDTSVSRSSIVSASLRSVQYRGSTFHFGRCWANVPRTFSTPGPRAPSPAFFIFWTLIYIRVTSISVTFCYDTNRK